MYLIETNRADERKWTRYSVMFADIEEAERHAIRLIESGEFNNARVVDERYRRGKK